MDVVGLSAIKLISLSVDDVHARISRAELDGVWQDDSIPVGHATFKLGDLEAVIGDNSAHEGHRAGYNGLWSLRHKSSPKNLFVPAVAGLNLEHIINGEDDRDRNIFFEPRVAPMTFRKINEHEAELHQPPTPTFHLESWTRFTLRAPHYVDMTFRCKAHQHVFPRGWATVFWASYIHGPMDKSMYFLGGQAKGERAWQQLCTQRHNDESTVLRAGEEQLLTFAKPGAEALYKNFSPQRFAEPHFHGRVDDLVFMVMLDRAENVRLAHSPSGGGFDLERNTSNPAWDFQFVIPKIELMREYGFRARTLLRPICPRAELLKEYEQWRKSLS